MIRIFLLFPALALVFAQAPLPPASSPAPAPAPASPAPTGTAAAAPSDVINATNTAGTQPPTFSVSLISVNPTAFPLSDIVFNETALPSATLSTTFAAGSIPTLIPGAPPLPDISLLNPQDYPPLDKPAPTDSLQAQQWISELMSQFVFPDIPPTQPGGCPANPEAAADTSRCWWTCGQCSRSTDIVTCPDKLTWGSSFDDGPAPYTPNLTDYLEQTQLKTTFFEVGSRVISRPEITQYQYMKGHQIAVHTWAHFPLTTLTTPGVIAELGWSKKIIFDVTGVTPRYWRPPYGDIDDRIRAIATAMNLTTIVWTSGVSGQGQNFDTSDFDLPGNEVSASGVLANFSNILKGAKTLETGFIVLEHDLFEMTVQLATSYILPEAIASNLNIQPIIQCLNLSLSDSYIETNDNETNPLPTAVGTVPLQRATQTASSGSSGGQSGSSGGGGSGSGSSSDGIILTTRLWTTIIASVVVSCVFVLCK